LRNCTTTNPDKNIVYYTQFGFNPTGCFRKSSELKVLVEGIEENPRLFLVNDIAYHLIRWEIKDIPLATYFASPEMELLTLTRYLNLLDLWVFGLEHL